MSKVIIYGFGRMGITHYAILNQLLDNGDFTFIDPDRKIGWIASKNLSAKMSRTDNFVSSDFDYALICTPPMFHVDILKKCLTRGIDKIFVEKPFGGLNSDYSDIKLNNSKVAIGYVLRYNPIVKWVKRNIDITKVVKVEASYNSNTIEKKPKGWRNSSFSGVANEVGSHLIDLCVYVFGISKPKIISNHVESVISDIDDIVISSLQEQNIEYLFSFNWVNKAYRKPVFRVRIIYNDQSEWRFDQQKIEFIEKGEVVKSLSIVDLAPAVPFYLRGIDFTLQMQDFLTSHTEIASLSDAMVTRDIIKNILNNEADFRR